MSTRSSNEFKLVVLISKEHPQGLLTGGSLLALWGLTVCIYRIAFHPAARFPGPLLAKVTDFYGVYHAIKGDGPRRLQKLHNKYGPVVRIGPNKVIFCSSPALQTIYNSRNIRKSQGYAAIQPLPGFSNSNTELDPDVHRAKRKAIGPAFTEQSLREFEPNIWKQVRIFEEQLRTVGARGKTDKNWSASIDMGAACRHFALDTVGTFAFGTSFDLQSEVKNRGIIGAMRAAMFVTGIIYNYPRLRTWGIPKLIKNKEGWTQQQWGAMVKSIVEDRLQRSVDAKADMFAFILRGNDDSEDKIPMEDLWAEARLTLLAGSDTTAASLSAVFFYLSRNPDKFKKLEKEIRTVFEKVDDIRGGAKLAQCKYLRAVIDEGMRLSPPVAVPLWREVMPEGGVIDGEFLAGGIDVGVSLHCLFHTASVFPDPFHFVPERWLDTGNPYPAHLEEARHAFRPFSLGSRGCVGASLAVLEMNILVARFVWHFELRPPTGPEAKIGAGFFYDADNKVTNFPEYQLVQHFTPDTEGPFLQVRERAA